MFELDWGLRELIARVSTGIKAKGFSEAAFLRIILSRTRFVFFAKWINAIMMQ
jgi:hypothetical protein